MSLDRRIFLKSSGALAAWWGLSPAGLAGSQPQSPTAKRGKTLVVVFLRGGIDGLNLVVPYGDADYYRLRNFIAVQKPGEQNGALDIDGFFGLHPWADALHPLFQDGTAVALHAVGYGGNSRSHFEEQDVWETGVDGNTLESDGWLNRHLATSTGHGPIRAISIGDTLPRILRGKERALALRGLDDLTFGEGASSMEAVMRTLRQAHGKDRESEAEDLLARGGRETLDALRELQKVAEASYEPKATYPNSDFGRRCREAARLIRSDVGVEVVELDRGGWDTHQNQGAVGGPYSNNVRDLTRSLAALCKDLEDRMDDVLILTLSEFGRTAGQNGTGGTDHGWGNCQLAIGGPVRRKGEEKARGVLGKWPGLAREQLNQGRDLAHTTDFRDVISEVVREHLGNKSLEDVLPGHGSADVGLV